MSLMDEENALAEADFAKVIRDEMGKPGTITIGYNNRNYDDEMTRFMFWRNLRRHTTPSMEKGVDDSTFFS